MGPDVAAIETRGLARAFGEKLAVESLDLRVERGETYGFLGPNGAGKTTTLRMLTGLLRPSAGSLRIEGLDPLEQADEIKRRIALVPDTPPLYDFLTGWQYVAFVASLYGVEPGTRDAEAAHLFDLFELTDARDDFCKGYSYGMKKKVHVIAMLITRPSVLFLDEPTTGLDPRSARRLKDHLGELRAGGMTVFLTTHLLDLAQELCDRVGILYAGRLVAEGTTAELCAEVGTARLEDVFLHWTGEEADRVDPARG